MELNHYFNFNDPVKIIEIFRYRKHDRDALTERSSEAAFGWEEVQFIKSYPYVDDWEEYKGSKYYIYLRNCPEPMLVLGDYESMLTYWTQFRNKYPLFYDQDKSED